MTINAMIDFQLTDEQLQIKELVKKFREKYIENLNIAEYEYEKKDPRDRFPWEIIREADKLGLRTLSISEEYGGGGVDTTSLCLAVEELSYGDMGIAVIFAQTWKIARALERAANKEQKERFIREFVKDPEMVLSIAGTEYTGGSDIWIPYNHPDYGIKTTAVLDGDEWVLNGKKVFISNAPQSKLFIVFARTDPKKPPYEGTSAFIVPSNAPGFKIGQVFDKLGERIANNAEVILDNVRIPKENLLGELNKAYEQILPFFGESNPMAGATALGTARRAYDIALEWARNRVQGGKPLIDQQAVGVLLADMKMKLEAAWNVILKAAWAFQHQKPYDPTLGWMAKVYPSEVAFEICRKVLELHGHHGILPGSRVEKCFRDATMFLHSDGANLALRIKIWNYIRGLRYTPS